MKQPCTVKVQTYDNLKDAKVACDAAKAASPGSYFYVRSKNDFHTVMLVTGPYQAEDRPCIVHADILAYVTRQTP